MGASAGLMQSSGAFATGTQGLSSMTNAYSQSQAIEAQTSYKVNMAGINSNLAEIQSQQAIDNGELEASTQENKAKQMVGAQKAGYAAQGVANNSGSAANVEASTQAMGELDAMTIRNNAARQAFGYKIAAINDTASGQFAAIEGQNAVTQTLLTGGMNAASAGMKAYYQYKTAKNNNDANGGVGYGGGFGYGGGLTVPSADSFSYSGSLGDFS